ncbi:MAG: VWA domain-containing protein [Wenzhouxiangellaceae bacterium]|nr:VWA domain-containing protein [Wenzhouxiangellaceae bacterium]
MKRHLPVFSPTLAAFGLTLVLAACMSQPADDAAIAEPIQASDDTSTQNPPPSQQPLPTPAVHPRAEVISTLAGRTRPSASFAADNRIGLIAPNRPVERENYANFDDNPVRRVVEHPVSTFSIDVDTGSYANVRRILREGRLPPADAVRVEELINYFSYDYPAPDSPETPFSLSIEQAITPWNPNTRLLQIGIQGYRPDPASIPAANLVFLVDVSGSMNSPDKLPLLVNSLKMLTRELDGDDRVAIVVYAGASGVVLESTPGDQHAKIISALDQLSAGGPTHGAAGIELAYLQAEQGFIDGRVNRVILATDGDFNVGMVDFEALKTLIERKRKSSIALTTLGFGAGNYNDRLMEQLADAGNGNHAYIDTLNEARKVLVDELSATLLTIAQDVKIQLEFNPAVVTEYRLIGYENRILKREDFNNDAVDAGDIGAGHTVTALYEIALAGSGGERIEPLRYRDEPRAATIEPAAREIGFVKLRYKQPGEPQSRQVEQAIEPGANQPISDRLAFAASVAAFGQHLRGGSYLEGFDLEQIHALASRSKGADPFGYRGEFLQLIRLAEGFGLARASDSAEKPAMVDIGFGRQ